MQPWLAPTGIRCRRWLNKSWAGFGRSSFRSRDQKQVPTFGGGLVFCLRACSLNLGHAVLARSRPDSVCAECSGGRSYLRRFHLSASLGQTVCNSSETVGRSQSLQTGISSHFSIPT